MRLQGWEKFAGGLNVKNDITGTDSIYTEWRENQIMYHVSTLLPYTPDDTQQVRAAHAPHVTQPDSKITRHSRAWHRSSGSDTSATTLC